jgi:NTP pyrophosphatase (non-canonical NTP hydrolase)
MATALTVDLVVRGAGFASVSTARRKQEAIAAINNSICAGTVRTHEEHQADFEGEEPTNARGPLDRREQEAKPQEGQGCKEGLEPGKWYSCGGPIDRSGRGQWMPDCPLKLDEKERAVVGFDPGKPFELGEVGATDDMVIAYVGHVKHSDAEQLFVDHHRERIKELEKKLADARMEIIRLKGDHQRACETIAAMHMEAVGEVRGPTRGVITDVADLRRERDELRNKAASLEFANAALTATSAIQGAAVKMLKEQLERVLKDKQPQLRSRRTVLVDIDD